MKLNTVITSDITSEKKETQLNSKDWCLSCHQLNMGSLDSVYVCKNIYILFYGSYVTW